MYVDTINFSVVVAVYVVYVDTLNFSVVVAVYILRRLEGPKAYEL